MANAEGFPPNTIEETSMTEHRCRLDFTIPATHRRLTGIIGTISKSSQDFDIIVKMIAAGLNTVRLNFSHDSQEFHARTIELVRKAVTKHSDMVGYMVPVAIAVDLKGPEIRTGLIEGNTQVELKKNDVIRLSTNKDLLERGSRDAIYVDYPNLIYVVEAGKQIFIDDGAIGLVVREVAVDCLICVVENGGILGSRKNVNIPNVDLDLPTVSEKDRSDLKFAISQNVDFVFGSSIQSASQVNELRNILGEKGKDIQIISKVENTRSLEHMDEIIAASDGILLARADIGVQVPMDKLFLAQKALISRCNRAGKPVICASHIMDSMYNHPKPTRAETSDIGNAILDGADCIMLSSETAIGKYPVECVEVLAKICREAELALWYRKIFEDMVNTGPALIDAVHAVAISAVETAKRTLAAAIIVLTNSGRSAYLVSRYRPRCPVMAVTRCSRTARQIHIRRCIIPILYTEAPTSDWLEDIENRIQFSMLVSRKMGIVRAGDNVVILTSWKDAPGFTNNMRVVYAFFEKEWFECILKKAKEEDKKIT